MLTLATANSFICDILTSMLFILLSSFSTSLVVEIKFTVGLLLESFTVSTFFQAIEYLSFNNVDTALNAASFTANLAA